MVYGSKAVMSTDIDHDSPHVVNYTEGENELVSQNGLDLLDEARELALSPMAIYLQGIRRYHSRRVRSRTFREGDLVLHLIQDKKGMHKLSPPWEGSFVVSRVLGNDSYYQMTRPNPKLGMLSSPRTLISSATFTPKSPCNLYD
jgi:hypothetical protein